MTTKPQIYAIGTCALSIHASFLKTLSIYFYFLFFLLNSPEGVPRTVAKKFYEIRATNYNFLFNTNLILTLKNEG